MNSAEKLHSLWCSYFDSISDDTNDLSKVDLHGAYVRVLKSPIISEIGKEGYIFKQGSKAISILETLRSKLHTINIKSRWFALYTKGAPKFILRF